jgi:CBS domain-containing protein
MAKTITDVMSANPCAIDASKPVAYAAKMMKQEDVGLAPIVEGDRLVGALTDRDIVTRVVAEGRDPQSVPVREVASTDLVTIDPQQDLDEALRLMASNQVRRLPVVAEDGRLVGVLARPTSPARQRTSRRVSSSRRSRRTERGGEMPNKRANVKNEKQYEALKDKGMSKERAAKIANSPGASSRGGKSSGSGSSPKQGGTTAQKKAAGRKGGKASARKS